MVENKFQCADEIDAAREDVEIAGNSAVEDAERSKIMTEDSKWDWP